jgi:hypothetical protein
MWCYEKNIFHTLSVLSDPPSSGLVTAVGNISVSSVPTGAAALLDGINTGTIIPTIIESVSGGSHIILLRFTGYQDYTGSVSVSDNATSTVSATLTAAPPPPTAYTSFQTLPVLRYILTTISRGRHLTLPGLFLTGFIRY